MKPHRPLQPLRIAAFTLAVGALAAAAARPAAAASADVSYTVEPCCSLCPRVKDRSAYNTKFLQSARTLVEGRDGWLFRTEDDLHTQFGPDEFGYKELRRLRDAMKKRGIELVLVYQPTRGLMHADKLPKSERARYNVQAARRGYMTALDRFRKLDIIVPDLAKLFEDAGSRDYFFRGDHHWTPYGAQRTAQLVAEEIRTLPAYAQIPKKNFVTVRSGVLAKRGTLQRAAAQLCGPGYPDQYVDRFETAAEGEGSLFGDEDIPQVTLVGTSNSDSAYNFGGFLSEYLGVDILNQAIAGGGHDGGLMQYLPSEEFHARPPRILIWELETYHNLSSNTFYRQIVPLINNGCRGSKKPILQRDVSVRGTGETQEVLFNGGGKVLELPGRNHLIDLQFNDPALRVIKTTIWYTNGSKETLHIDHSPRVDARGRFVLELRTDGAWGDRNFLSLDIGFPEGAPPGLSVNAQLCGREDAAPNRTQQAVR